MPSVEEISARVDTVELSKYEARIIASWCQDPVVFIELL